MGGKKRNISRCSVLSQSPSIVNWRITNFKKQRQRPRVLSSGQEMPMSSATVEQQIYCYLQLSVMSHYSRKHLTFSASYLYSKWWSLLSLSNNCIVKALALKSPGLPRQLTHLTLLHRNWIVVSATRTSPYLQYTCKHSQILGTFPQLLCVGPGLLQELQMKPI